MLVCINGERNIGKTFASYAQIIKEGGFTPDKKVAFIRNSEEQLKIMKADFNTRFYNRFLASGNQLFNLKKNLIISKNGDEIITYSKDQCIGYIGALSTFTKLKSIEALNLRYVFFEEYNEDYIGHDCYPKFIDLLTTLTRFNIVKTLMIGNRVSYTNDFLVNWNILPQESYDEDYFIKFSKKGFFIELGTKQFKQLHNDETLFYELAQFNKKSQNQMAGKYYDEFDRRVINYQRILDANFRPICNFIYMEQLYCLGRIFYDNRECYGMLSYYNYTNTKLPNYTLDNASQGLRRAKLTDDEDRLEIIKMLFGNHKKMAIYYDSFDLLQKIKDIIFIMNYGN